jgi:hypothetical protein
LKIEAQEWGELCRLGSISDRPRDIMDAYENAVAAEPLNGSFRDSRVIARARTGDRHGAIDDFGAFVAWAREKLNTRIGYQEVARLIRNERTGFVRSLQTKIRSRRA